MPPAPRPARRRCGGWQRAARRPRSGRRLLTGSGHRAPSANPTIDLPRQRHPAKRTRGRRAGRSGSPTAPAPPPLPPVWCLEQQRPGQRLDRLARHPAFPQAAAWPPAQGRGWWIRRQRYKSPVSSTGSDLFSPSPASTCPAVVALDPTGRVGRGRGDGPPHGPQGPAASPVCAGTRIATVGSPASHQRRQAAPPPPPPPLAGRQRQAPE